jgi:hypothetical protein
MCHLWSVIAGVFDGVELCFMGRQLWVSSRKFVVLGGKSGYTSRK